jgi:hypothetical protein
MADDDTNPHRRIVLATRYPEDTYNTKIAEAILPLSLPPAPFVCPRYALPHFVWGSVVCFGAGATGITLITASNRRNPPQCVDSKIHHCNLINNILPKVQANVAGAADAIMLDIEGFVSETNATNLFLVKE